MMITNFALYLTMAVSNDPASDFLESVGEVVTQPDEESSAASSAVNCAVQACIHNCNENPNSFACWVLWASCDSLEYTDPSYPYTSPGKCRAEGCRRANNPDHEPVDVGNCPQKPRSSIGGGVAVD